MLRVDPRRKLYSLARAGNRAAFLCGDAYLLLRGLSAGEERLRGVLRLRSGHLRQHHCHDQESDQGERRYHEQANAHLDSPGLLMYALASSLTWCPGADMKTRQIRLNGRVQGVGFRYALRDEAQRLGLNGWVRNCIDGSVEALLQGETHAVEALV